MSGRFGCRLRFWVDGRDGLQSANQALSVRCWPNAAVHSSIPFVLAVSVYAVMLLRAALAHRSVPRPEAIALGALTNFRASYDLTATEQLGDSWWVYERCLRFSDGVRSIRGSIDVELRPLNIDRLPTSLGETPRPRLVGFIETPRPARAYSPSPTSPISVSTDDTRSLGRHGVSEPVNTVDTLHATACRR